ncbi:bis(5'-nucleosyl)-tetraphosphatase (symmetrical) YqeK [Paenibacillus sp. alder61]|uniref:bis(5'-nucleosyl)-tetraphosphatase (symmetrical) n=1 Tax=Paenibacillus faecis TaxID=862114 RepID=A0A5D0CSA7_9BACL|nr:MULTISPECIES: bis(5'-nucleosyl)-tetraphosphatase (symmetrical) YqeK [Paenibacillus]MCA1292912.1 bis(5'-nucleosyl)-tetraphosphatase (symmetrical) YqeK [Paenibacillus sp. alder61]TYA12876.1 HD domain-containing protein [Paenibacillus faecis]
MVYNREQLIGIVSGQMPAKRWKHVEGVMQTAVELARRYGADPVKADLAALLHDLAKFWPVERQEAVIRENGLNAELLDHDKQLLHAEVAAFISQRDYGVDDPEVLDAIRYHTSGRVGMTQMDKIVCLADYIEPGREFPGVERIRELAEVSLEEALLAGFDSTISFLLEKKKAIFPLTVLARNDLIAQLKKRNPES